MGSLGAAGSDLRSRLVMHRDLFVAISPKGYVPRWNPKCKLAEAVCWCELRQDLPHEFR
jgi:hypothetical protein